MHHDRSGADDGPGADLDARQELDPLPTFEPRPMTGGPDGRDPIVSPPLTITWAPKKQSSSTTTPLARPT